MNQVAYKFVEGGNLIVADAIASVDDAIISVVVDVVVVDAIVGVVVVYAIVGVVPSLCCRSF